MTISERFRGGGSTDRHDAPPNTSSRRGRGAVILATVVLALMSMFGSTAVASTPTVTAAQAKTFTAAAAADRATQAQAGARLQAANMAATADAAAAVKDTAAVVKAAVAGLITIKAAGTFNPGAIPGAGAAYTFSDGSFHQYGAWKIGSIQWWCQDANRTQPLNNTSGTTYKYTTFSAPNLAFQLFKYGNTTDPVTGEAMAWLVHNSPETAHRNIGAYEFQNYTDPTKHVANTAAITAKINAIKADAAAHAGPLTLKLTVTNPTATSSTGTVKVAVVNAKGVDQAGYKVTLSGASGMSGSVTSGTSPVTVKFTATNSQKGTIKGAVAGLPPTTARLATAANSAFQNLVGTNTNTLASAASAAYARPAAPITTGKAQAVKVSTANAGLGLAGAQIHVHAGTATGADKGVLTTAAGGKSNLLTLAPGKYVGVETVAPSGYQRNAPNVTFTVTTGKTTVITFKDSPVPNTGTAQAVKVSSANAGLGLAGAQIHVHAGTAAGADKGTLTTAAGGKSNILTLAPGTYVGVETVAPSGYQRNAANVTFTVTTGKVATITFRDAPVVVVPKQSVVSVLKAADDTTGPIEGKYGPLGGTTWTASSSDGKTVLGTDVSDSAGKVSIPVDVPPGTDVLLTETDSGSPDYTVAPPQHVTSTLDGTGTALYTAVDHRIVPHLVLTKTIIDPVTHQVMKGMSPAGAYYTLTNATTGAVINSKAGPTDAAGQLTGDFSALHSGDQVTAVEIVSPIAGAIDPTPFTGTVTTDGAGNLGIALAQADVPVTIGTNAANQKDGSKFYVPGDTAVDAVDYHGLLPGRPATVNGSASCVNSDGSQTPIPGATGSTTFNPSSADGTVDVTIKLPVGMSPCVVSVYEQLVISGTVVADHNKGGTDTHQQLWSPTIGTTLTNGADGSKIFHPGDTGVDAVAYTHVQPGVPVTVKASASCINLTTGVQTPIPGATGATTFTPSSTSGTVNVSIKLPSTMAPCTVTIYEQWTVAGKIITDSNKSGKDVSEQGFMPTIGTLLTNAANGSKYFNWGDTGIDAVAYSGLQPGTAASVTGTAYCLNSNGTLSSIPGATATQAFTASATGAGTVNVSIKIPTELGTPCTITVVEKLLIGGRVVQTHNTNGQDHQEQGHMPWLKTTLVGPDGGKATVIDSASTKLTDQVACFDVINGEKYYVTGDLRIDDNTVKGKGTGITGKSTVFTANGSKLCTTVPFQLTGALLPAGNSATIVAFEYLHLAATGATIASHEQIKDVDQALGVQHPAAAGGGGGGGGGAVTVNTGLGADNTSSTGDIVAGSIGIAAVVALLALGTVIGIRRRRTNSVGTPQ